MPLHATTIRFADPAWALIRDYAADQGISVSQYVREAALIRTVLDGLEHGPGGRIASAHDLATITREVRRLASVESED